MAEKKRKKENGKRERELMARVRCTRSKLSGLAPAIVKSKSRQKDALWKVRSQK